MVKGTLGSDLEVQEGYEAAMACAIGILSTIKGSYDSSYVLG